MSKRSSLKCCRAGPIPACGGPRIARSDAMALQPSMRPNRHRVEQLLSPGFFIGLFRTHDVEQRILFNIADTVTNVSERGRAGHTRPLHADSPGQTSSTAEQSFVSRDDYFTVLRNYALSHRRKLEDGRIIPWIDENLNPFTGDWISRTLLIQRGKAIPERGKDYNHSTFCDLVISGLVGLRARGESTVEVNPLAPSPGTIFA